MSKKVLDVGQCDPDHGAIRRVLEKEFDATVVRTHQAKDTLEELKKGGYSLVLVNRKLDTDYSDGMDILRQIKEDPDLAAAPVMIVTNYPEHQQASVAAGGVPGFGKAELNSPETIEKLSRYLN